MQNVEFAVCFAFTGSLFIAWNVQMAFDQVLHHCSVVCAFVRLEHLSSIEYAEYTPCLPL